tara:strand:+ start:215976 stop:216209 length:234 start_codon:yes stop_codon:yes gene_type:complete
MWICAAGLFWEVGRLERAHPDGSGLGLVHFMWGSGLLFVGTVWLVIGLIVVAIQKNSRPRDAQSTETISISDQTDQE